jgi:hypothetical protein
MALDVFFKSDIQATILAGLVSTIATAQASGTFNTEYLRGALAAYQHQALVVGCDWQGIVSVARQALGTDVAGLLDAASVLEG